MITRLILLAAAASALGACGRLGDLQQPPPLFGEAAKAEYRARQNGAAQPADEIRRNTSEAEGSAIGEQPAVAPRGSGALGTQAAPVNIPPTPVAPQPAPQPQPRSPG